MDTVLKKRERETLNLTRNQEEKKEGRKGRKGIKITVLIIYILNCNIIYNNV